ncbi:MAG TPA: hypothetical protein VNK23_03845 [Candidatus Dormibacteraeota bacterium]|nr:hypothetical protein [Candidatus Dormibacteraeota bacterium]
MSGLAFADGHSVSEIQAEAETVASAYEETLMREKMEALRDVLIALGLQLVFRATLLLRHWNY